MRILAGIVLCVSMVAVLWRPESRAAPAWLSLALIVLCILLATADHL